MSASSDLDLFIRRNIVNLVVICKLYDEAARQSDNIRKPNVVRSRLLLQRTSKATSIPADLLSVIGKGILNEALIELELRPAEELPNIFMEMRTRPTWNGLARLLGVLAEANDAQLPDAVDAVLRYGYAPTEFQDNTVITQNLQVLQMLHSSIRDGNYEERLSTTFEDLYPRSFMPTRERLTIDDIDSFERVKSVPSSSVARLFDKKKYLDLPEDTIQQALEEILSVVDHQKDWGGEYNDLYTSNVVVFGRRVSTAFLLKGKSLRRPVLRIKDCGKSSDQLVHLFNSPAELFVIQAVGTVAQEVIKDVQGHTAKLRSKGEPAQFLIMDGQDTARLLVAYGKLALPPD